MAAPGWLSMGDPAWLRMGDPGWLSFPDPGGSSMRTAWVSRHCRSLPVIKLLEALLRLEGLR